jgi:tRNA pseudouridine13 synthase
MIGPKGLQATSEAAELERSVLSQLPLDDRQLEVLGRHAPGARRDLIVFPEKLKVELTAPDRLVVSFSLPSGSYATELLREFTGAPFLDPRKDKPLT